MEANFWHQKWERGEIGFHNPHPNPLLVKHVDQLSLNKGRRVFLPLCGMTLDIAWLLDQGVQVVGVELSQFAIDQLFEVLQLEPQIIPVGNLLRYSAQAIDIFVGNLFDLSAENLGQVDAIYDRASLVALPDTTRQRYASHLISLSSAVPQLLITYEYDQSQMAGPPFSVSKSEIEQLYDRTYQLQLIECKSVTGGLKGRVAAMESVWLLEPKK